MENGSADIFCVRQTPCVNNKSGTSTSIHETAHVVETNGSYLNMLTQIFCNYRGGNEKAVPMSPILAGYKKGEGGRKDNYDRAFGKNGVYCCGNDYGLSSTELLSMGLEKLANDPVSFFAKDPEYARFVLSALQYKSSHEMRKKGG